MGLLSYMMGFFNWGIPYTWYLPDKLPIANGLNADSFPYKVIKQRASL